MVSCHTSCFLFKGPKKLQQMFDSCQIKKKGMVCVYISPAVNTSVTLCFEKKSYMTAEP